MSEPAKATVRFSNGTIINDVVKVMADVDTEWFRFQPEPGSKFDRFETRPFLKGYTVEDAHGNRFYIQLGGGQEIVFDAEAVQIMQKGGVDTIIDSR